MIDKTSLKGKPVTIVFTIEDEEEFSKHNLLNLRVCGMTATAAAAYDALEQLDTLEAGLETLRKRNWT